MKKVERKYVLFMKKCFVLKEMSDIRNNPKWKQLRIKNRFTLPVRKYYGTYVQLNYDMANFGNILQN